MSVQVTDRTPTVQVLQGIPVDRAVIDPATFYRATRRRRFTQKGAPFNGLGNSDNFSLFQDGIVGAIHLRVSGSLVVANGTAGTTATTRRWPYDLVKRVRFSANGQTNLITCSGLKLKAWEQMYPDRSDRGVSQTIVATATNQGTLSLASESWGVGSGATAIANGTYNFDLEYLVPVAMDLELLTGAIFAQTQSTDLVLAIDWATPADLFVVTGTASAVAVTATFEATGKIFSIPIVEGRQVLPDLSQFHSLIEGAFRSLGNGDNDVPLPGIGVGRALQRVYFQTWNGAAPQVPLLMNATNYGPQSWLYGGADIPERYPTGQTLRYENEQTFDSDYGGVWGFGVHDFASKFALRDAVDEGATPNLRLGINVPTGVVLTSPVVEFVQETMFLAPVSA